MIAQVGQGDSPANGDPVTLGDYVLHINMHVGESAAKGTVYSLESFGSNKNRIRVRKAVRLALRAKHLINRCFTFLVPDLLKPTLH